MTCARRATVCVLTYGDFLNYYQRCLESLLATTPLDAVELRLGFNSAPKSFAYALGRLAGADTPRHNLLPGAVERYAWDGPAGVPVLAWQSPANLYKEPMARLMYHDVRLGTDYTLWLDDDSFVEPGWWEALVPPMDQGVDYLGQPWWVTYLPGQEEMFRTQPWYRGVPFARRDGRTGVDFMTGGFMGLRTDRLYEADFPNTNVRWRGMSLQQYGGDTLLGEIARQLG